MSTAETPGQPFWKHWHGALLGGVLLRCAAVAAGYGYFASDDYFHVMEPAWRWLHTPDAGLPSDFRSAVPALLVHAFFRLARAFGVDAPHHQLQVAYLGLGLLNCLTIPAVWHLARPRLGPQVALAAAWLAAAHAWMPRIGTRGLVEGMAQPLLLWGLVALQHAVDTPEFRTRVRDAVAGGVLLGGAVMFRLQVASAAPGVLVALVWLLRGNARAMAGVVGGTTVGLLVPLVGQGLVDQAYLGEFLAYPVRYLRFNLEHSAGYGVEPWHTYVGLLLLYSMPPAALVLWRPLRDVARGHVLVTAALVCFVVVHSAVGHKEDRFLFPVLPLWCVLLGGMLTRAWTGTRLQRAAVTWFVGLNAALLLLVTASDEHRNATTPLKETVSMVPQPLVVGAGDLRLPALYANGDANVLHQDNVTALLAQLDARPAPAALRWVALEPPPQAMTQWLESHGYRCDAPSTRESGLLDRLLVLANPRNNPRRRPSVVVDCARQ